MNRKPVQGFSLLELLIALSIVAILATITIPSFSGMLAKSRRSDAMSALLQVQLAQERWRASHILYASSLDELEASSLSPEGYYRLSVYNADAYSYTVVAEPVDVQSADSCGSFAVDSSGPVHHAGFAGPACWSR